MQNLCPLIERVQGAILLFGESPYKALAESGAGKNFIANMRKGSMPSAEKFIALADYLDCSVDYLLGRTDNPEINTSKRD